MPEYFIQGPMPRTDQRQQPDTAALRRAWVAARLSGIGTQRVPEWAAENGLPTTSKTGFERAVGPVRATAPGLGQRGRPGRRRSRKEVPQIRDWLLVDESALGLKKMIYRLPNDGLPQPQVLNALRSTNGVRQ